MAYIIFKTPIRPSRNPLSHKASLKLLARGLLGILCFVIAADIAAHLFQGLKCVPDLNPGAIIFSAKMCWRFLLHFSNYIYNPLNFNSTVDTLQRSFFHAHANELIIMQEVFPEWCVIIHLFMCLSCSFQHKKLYLKRVFFGWSKEMKYCLLHFDSFQSIKMLINFASLQMCNCYLTHIGTDGADHGLLFAYNLLISSNFERMKCN